MFPLFDSEKTTEVVVAFGVDIPKGIAGRLRGMSVNLGDELAEITAAIQELAASAAQISINEQGSYIKRMRCPDNNLRALSMPETRRG